MSEYTLQLITFCKFLWIAVFTYLYGLGGINNKWLRRFVGSAWFALGIFAFSKWEGHWDWWTVATPLIFLGGLTLPYGADKLAQKVGLRAICGLVFWLSALPLAVHSQLWLLYGFYGPQVITSSIVFGVFNPFKTARDEESNIASAAICLPMFMV